MSLYILLILIFAVIVDRYFMYLKQAETRAQKNEMTEIQDGTMFFWNVIVKYVFCSLIGFGLRYLQDRKTLPKPDWLFQLLAGIAVSYLVYILYDFYKWSFAPLEFLLMAGSWLGGYVVMTADGIAKNGIRTYIRKLAEDILAYTRKEKT